MKILIKTGDVIRAGYDTWFALCISSTATGVTFMCTDQRGDVWFSDLITHEQAECYLGAEWKRVST